MSTQQLIDEVRAWGAEKGLTGPDGKATIGGQVTKLDEELNELCAAILSNDDDGIIDAIGDMTVVLILLGELVGTKIEDCLKAAYVEIAGRTGTMVGGVFVKDVKEGE